jgi:hypothetical protein
MRIEFYEKIQDLTDEEIYHRDEMGIVPKDKRYKWRKALLWLDSIYSVFEANEKETILEYGELLLTVRGNYKDTVQRIMEAELEIKEDE